MYGFLVLLLNHMLGLPHHSSIALMIGLPHHSSIALMLGLPHHSSIALI